MKNFYLATIVLIAAMLLALPATAQANLLNNPGFESGLDWWAINGDANVETWAARTGVNGGGTHPSGWGDTGTGEILQDVAVTAGTTYDYTVYAKRDPGDLVGSFYMKLYWYQGDTPLSTDSQAITLSSDEFALKNLSATAPVNASKVKVAFGSITASQAGKFDDADFSPIPEPTSMLLLGSGLLGLFGLSRKKSVK